MFFRHLRWTIALLLVARGAFAAVGSEVQVMGRVSDFDGRYVFLDARTERYRIARGAVPDSVELKPGSIVTLEVPLSDFKMVPATAPITPPAHYSPPRKRTPKKVSGYFLQRFALR